MKDGLVSRWRTASGSLCISASSGHMGALVVKMRQSEPEFTKCKGLF